MSGKTYLITGANRGLGRALFNHYIAQPNNTIVAGVRNIEGARPLLSATRGNNTKVLLAKIDSASKTDPYNAVKDLQDQGITHFDVVVSAAGIFRLNTIEDMPLEELEEVLMVNAISVVLLYKATLPLLRMAKHPAKFAFISGAGGSLNDMHNHAAPLASHACSKAMANSLVIKMGMENDWLTTLCINPGLVQTDLGNGGARMAGLKEAPVTLEQFTMNTSHIIDNATKREHSEKFFDETLDRIHPW